MLHPSDPEFRAFVRGLILRKARRLVRLAALRPQDQEDFEQSMAAEFEKRRPAYDPNRGTPEAFASKVVHNCSQNYVRDRFCTKRHDPDCRPVHRSCTNGAKRPVEARCGTRRLNEQELKDLQIDLEAALQGMPDELRKLAELLKHHSVAEAARILGLPRMTLYTSKNAIRRRFEREGLRKYL